MPKDQLHVPKESSFPILSKHIDVVRQRNTNLDNLEESNVDDLWNINGNRISLKVGADPQDSAS